MSAQIWFTSDTHYGHRNIVRGVSNWRDENGNPSPGPRDFDTLEEHNESLVEGINSVVKENDTLYHLGDWSFGGKGNIWEFRKQLNVKTIHLILGNHDHHIKSNTVLPNVYWCEVEHDRREGSPDPSSFRLEVNTQELFTSVNQVKQKKIGGHMFFMSHYAHRVWDNAHHGAVHLYGHSHGTLPDYYNQQMFMEAYVERNEDNVFHEEGGVAERFKYKCMDVGVDTHPEFRPYNLDEILEIMKDRVSLSVDHHNKRTT